MLTINAYANRPYIGLTVSRDIKQRTKYSIDVLFKCISFHRPLVLLVFKSIVLFLIRARCIVVNRVCSCVHAIPDSLCVLFLTVVSRLLSLSALSEGLTIVWLSSVETPLKVPGEPAVDKENDGMDAYCWPVKTSVCRAGI